MVVMKYGGTSVRDAEAVRRVIAQVRAERGRPPRDGGSSRGPVLVV